MSIMLIFYKFTFALQVVFYLLALVGWLQSRREEIARMFYIPYYFCLVNWASLKGIIENYTGRTYTVWNTVREK